MFKGNRKYFWVLGIVFILIVVLQFLTPKPVNWVRTYMKKDKIPFGCYAIYNLIENFYAQTVELNKQTLYYLTSKNNEGKTTLIMVNDKINLSKLETENLMRFVSEGNKALISANNFLGHLKDTFNIQQDYNWEMQQGISFDSLMKKPLFTVKFINPESSVEQKYTYSKATIESWFSSFDTSAFKIVSIDEFNHPVLLSRKIQKGTLYLSSLPDVFSNLVVVKDPNRNYVYTLLSLVKNDKIIWDEYYKSSNMQNTSILKFIFDNDSLYRGYCVLLLSLVFFMTFAIKRKTRPVPVIAPLQNSTLQFVDVVGNVYFNSNNHLYIAIERINYFYFEIRTKFHINTIGISNDFYKSLAQLSGLTEEEIKNLFSYCENLKKAPSLSEEDLMELNERINIFKQKSKQ